MRTLPRCSEEDLPFHETIDVAAILLVINITPARMSQTCTGGTRDGNFLLRLHWSLGGLGFFILAVFGGKVTHKKET